MTNASRFYVGPRNATELLSPTVRYIIAVGPNPVIEKRSNGQHSYMQYRIERTARAGLRRAAIELPNARILKYGHAEGS